jgi:SAM-dependent methyltransferase
MRENHYRAKLPFRARNHADLVRLAGGVFDDIDERLRSKAVVRVLELGCGYGGVLLELRQRYGTRVELHGINRRPGDGDLEIFLRTGVDRGLVVPGSQVANPLPTIDYADVADGLPYADDSFDVVYSQVAWLYFGNKVGVLREVSRVLAGDGIAKIDADELRPGLPPEYARLVEIWDGGVLLPFRDYLQLFDMAFAAAADGEYLRFGKVPRFGTDLDLVAQIDLSRICPHWDGVKCVYRRGMVGADAASGVSSP